MAGVKKFENRNWKLGIGRLAAAGALVLVGVAAAAPQRIGPALGPVSRIEHIRPAAHFEFCTNVYWYPHVIKPVSAGATLERMTTERQAGGLVMKLREDIMPRSKPPGGVWFTLFRPIHGQGHPGLWKVEPSPVCFGTVRPAPMLPGEHFLSEEKTTWGANKLTYTYMAPTLDGEEEEESDFSISISRLSPAVMVEGASDMVIFFSELPKSPRHFAWPEAGKMRYHSIPEDEMAAFSMAPWQESASKTILDDDYDNVEMDKPGWVLVWFGENGSYFHASRDGRWLHDFHMLASSGEGHPIGIESVLKGRSGSTVEADMPFLLVFQNPPISFCVVEGGGIRFTFAEPAGRIALLPLFGEDLPSAGEDKGWQAGLTMNTRSWADNLPEAMREKCEWWEKRLRQFPVDVEESAAYDAASDELILKYSFKYEHVGEGGIKFAPVPPMLALAVKMGFPARMPELVEPGYFTQAGPYIGVENADGYEIRMSGLCKYARQARAAGPGACPGSERLEARLTREVGKMLEAGRLAPGLYHSAIDTRSQFRWGGPSFVWDRPGETLRCLSEALDFLPDEMRPRVVAHMKDEQAVRPAETTIMVPIRDGARREPYRLDTRMPKWHDFSEKMEGYKPDIIEFAECLSRHNDRYLKEQIMPPDALYALAEYARCVPEANIDWPVVRGIMDAYDARRDWAILGFVKRQPSLVGVSTWSTLSQGGGRDASFIAQANAYLAGCIGMVRFASVFGAKPEMDEAYARFCLAAVYRFALETYGQWLYADGLLRLPDNFKPDFLAKRYSDGAWVGWRDFIMNFTPETDPRQIAEIDEMHVSLGRSGGPLAGEAVPELGRFLNDLLGERLRAKAAAAYQPEDWFVWNGGGYGYKKRLGNAEYFFKAWIQGASADELTAWLGAPWATVGDLYYIQRLVEALYACRGVEWREWK